MVKDVTRSRLIQVWFGAIAMAAAMAVSLGASVTVGTGFLLFAMCLVPPAIVLMLWPGAEVPTAADVLHGTSRRP